MQSRLTPYNDSVISYPGLQRIVDFTSDGSEAHKYVHVQSDTGVDYVFDLRNTSISENIIMQFNSDTGTNYGRQNIDNTSGGFSAAQVTNQAFQYACLYYGTSTVNIRCIPSFPKLSIVHSMRWGSGVTILQEFHDFQSWSTTSEVTLIDFKPASGNFTSGTRIIGYVRRSQ